VAGPIVATIFVRRGSPTTAWLPVMLSGASFRGSAAQPPKTKPGKEDSRFALAPLASLAGVAHLKSARATEDAAWRRFAG
jgi:hypothetical protein